ncbi:ACP S-malonyltransferase [Coxiella endosymbiont of Amblyomma nuttalli]|uniref:ACP S-malonyltransferase n=1 Tax=Coxiella endosymbiont of Amblyomma nuttalli TaxID=2749996 RepID=UPI001BADFD94|nr:ACP S-malonyltransferase [Coxiella endosymbiont of Amblyomma nuttalli]QTS84104.1 Malonyl CoA-acyl carrier protein transacylase [Coxiella endosymbiont of Amblyomma nuttalli]
MLESFAFVFPGQGSQQVGMLAELAMEHPIVKETFQEASVLLGYDLWELSQKGPKERLDQTEFTQPALLVAGVAIFRFWESLGGEKPKMMAGHSLGEYIALVCAEALTFKDAVLLVENRGRYMQEAVHPDEGAMGAIIGMDEAQVQTVCKRSEKGKIVKPANLNCPDQVVISGHTDAVDRALALAKAEGAKIVIRISVSVPSHCPLMQPAADRLAQDLKKITISSPVVPIIHNMDVTFHVEPEAIREALVQQLVNPVRWIETIQMMVKRGIKLFIECGPNNKLAGLNKRIDPHTETLSLKTMNMISGIIRRLS